MRRNFLFLSLPIVFLLACQISKEEGIHQILNRREEALRKEDPSLYLFCISNAYRDREEDFSQIQKEWRVFWNL